MGKSKLKRKKWTKILANEPTDSRIPISNLPEKFLLMRVKSGTKIRNVLGYALKEFTNYNSIVWTAAGQGIGKAISCAELFKRKQQGLHQITKLRYVESAKSRTENKGDANAENRHVPEIHILLTKEIKDTSEPGYQAPDDCGEFLEDEDTKNRREDTKQERGSMSGIAAEEFAAMGLRTGHKRPKKEHQADAPPKKNKKKEKGGRS